jgi:hypothetical protein
MGFPAVFAFASRVMGQPHTALFAVFDGYAILALPTSADARPHAPSLT